MASIHVEFAVSFVKFWINPIILQIFLQSLGIAFPFNADGKHIRFKGFQQGSKHFGRNRKNYTSRVCAKSGSKTVTFRISRCTTSTETAPERESCDAASSPDMSAGALPSAHPVGEEQVKLFNSKYIQAKVHKWNDNSSGPLDEQSIECT